MRFWFKLFRLKLFKHKKKFFFIQKWDQTRKPWVTFGRLISSRGMAWNTWSSCITRACSIFAIAITKRASNKCRSRQPMKGFLKLWSRAKKASVFTRGATPMATYGTLRLITIDLYIFEYSCQIKYQYTWNYGNFF